MGGVMVSVLTPSAVHRAFKPLSSKTKDTKLISTPSPLSMQH